MAGNGGFWGCWRTLVCCSFMRRFRRRAGGQGSGLDGGVWLGHNFRIIMHSYRHFNHTHTRIGGWESCERYGITGIAFRLTSGATRLTSCEWRRPKVLVKLKKKNNNIYNIFSTCKKIQWIILILINYRRLNRIFPQSQFFPVINKANQFSTPFPPTAYVAVCCKIYTICS